MSASTQILYTRMNIQHKPTDFNCSKCVDFFIFMFSVYIYSFNWYFFSYLSNEEILLITCSHFYTYLYIIVLFSLVPCVTPTAKPFCSYGKWYVKTWKMYEYMSLHAGYKLRQKLSETLQSFLFNYNEDFSYWLLSYLYITRILVINNWIFQ